MSEKKGFIARLLGKQDESDCCAVRIEEVPETEVARMPAAKKGRCQAIVEISLMIGSLYGTRV
ncbi:hypothetical protein ACPVDA_003297 [Pseudomonas aeruginosa]